MEASMILKSLHSKSILVTGATGFLAKCFVEKVLRVQPNVKMLYLLVRANDATSAKQRVENEVASKEVFKALKETYGESFQSFFWSKVAPLAGDVTLENLGVRDEALLEDLWRNLDFIVHSAATTSFYDRYDMVLEINVLGVKNTRAFGRRCENLQMFLRISTAYVRVQKKGIALEDSIGLDNLSNKTIDEEIAFVENQLKELKRSNTPEKVIARSMKSLGLKRAKMFGWPNAYSLTKAMGEILIGDLREELPLVILRPTIVTSTFKEPFSGWIEGLRTMDKLIAYYATGRMVSFPGRRSAILDVIPVDMVVNAMITSMATHSKEEGGLFIYHVGSSSTNALKVGMLNDSAYEYFQKHPRTREEDGKPLSLPRPLVVTSTTFSIFMTLRYKIPHMVLWLVALLICSRNLKNQYKRLNEKYNYGMLLAKLYEPYCFIHARFDDANLEKLRRSMNSIDREMFGFDPKYINWAQFLMEVHIPGIMTLCGMEK